jgi:hypothetical protein
MMMMSAFVQDQQAWLDLHSANFLKEEYKGRYVAQLADIVLILSNSVFALSP